MFTIIEWLVVSVSGNLICQRLLPILHYYNKPKPISAGNTSTQIKPRHPKAEPSVDIKLSTGLQIGKEDHLEVISDVVFDINNDVTVPSAKLGWVRVAIILAHNFFALKQNTPEVFL